MDSKLPPFWILFLLLLMLMSCGVNGNHSDHLPVHCNFMLVEPRVFQRWCVGTYPWLAYIKYQDKLINVGEPYGLYMTLAQDSILVLHKKSPLLKCRNLMFKNKNSFVCLDRDHNVTITVNDATMHCLPFHIKLPDDLMNECLKQNDFQHKNEYLVEVLRARRCILHYTLGEEGAQPLQMPIILLILAILLQLQ
ncbi:hypothetical protein KR038_010726 [Drosophila bunnanda]|nr:hypothetical protein KR038_010726 [Drosophila bunnanda]